MADAEAIAEILIKLLADYDAIPYLINCAGNWKPQPVIETTEEDMLQAMKVYAFAHVHTMRAVLPAMREHNFGAS